MLLILISCGLILISAMVKRVDLEAVKLLLEHLWSEEHFVGGGGLLLQVAFILKYLGIHNIRRIRGVG